MKLPASSIEEVDTEFADVHRKLLQGILPPGYKAGADGSVFDPTGKLVVEPTAPKE